MVSSDENDAKYQAGVKDGLKGGVMDDWALNLSKGFKPTDPGKAYLAGYSRGAEQRYKAPPADEPSDSSGPGEDFAAAIFGPLMLLAVWVMSIGIMIAIAAAIAAMAAYCAFSLFSVLWGSVVFSAHVLSLSLLPGVAAVAGYFVVIAFYIARKSDEDWALVSSAPKKTELIGSARSRGGLAGLGASLVAFWVTHAYGWFDHSGIAWAALAGVPLVDHNWKGPLSVGWIAVPGAMGVVFGFLLSLAGLRAIDSNAGWQRDLADWVDATRNRRPVQFQFAHSIGFLSKSSATALVVALLGMFLNKNNPRPNHRESSVPPEAGRPSSDSALALKPVERRPQRAKEVQKAKSKSIVPRLSVDDARKSVMAAAGEPGVALPDLLLPTNRQASVRLVSELLEAEWGFRVTWRREALGVVPFLFETDEILIKKLGKDWRIRFVLAFVPEEPQTWLISRLICQRGGGTKWEPETDKCAKKFGGKFEKGVEGAVAQISE